MPIIVEAQGCTDANVLEEEVDEDIGYFAHYFESLGNDKVSPFEKAAIKTYLHWKIHGEPSAAETSTSAEGTDAEEATG